MRNNGPVVSRDPNQNGQVAVVILLVVVVLATLGLSQLSQTTEDLFISSQREESTRVFNAAESGVDRALSDESNFDVDGVDPFSFEEDGSTVNVSVAEEDTLETVVNEGETATIDVNNDNQIRVMWGEATSCEAASLMVAAYGETGTDNVQYWYLKPESCDADSDHAGRNNDDFLRADPGAGDYANRYDLNIDTSDTLVRITPLYAPTNLSVTGADVTQAHTVRSVAETDVEAGAENTIQQIIEVQRTIPAAPEYMNYALFTNGTIQRNN